MPLAQKLGRSPLIANVASWLAIVIACLLLISRIWSSAITSPSLQSGGASVRLHAENLVEPVKSTFPSLFHIFYAKSIYPIEPLN